MTDNSIRVVLERVESDVREIKNAIMGDGFRDGLLLDVDRLKRSRSNHNAVLWMLFTTLLGVVGTVAAQAIAGRIP